MTSDRTEAGAYKCPRCDRTFVTQAELLAHERTPMRTEQTPELEPKDRLGTHATA